MFFIVASARSGTTLLRLMLNAHPHVAVPPESRFITELWTDDDEVSVESFLGALGGHRQFQAWDLPVGSVRDELGDRTRVPYVEAITSAYRAYARSKGKSRWGDKTPRYVEHIDRLARLFPGSRFIHLLRDGRNVALSYADVPFGPKTVAKAAALWARRVGGGMTAGRALEGGRYIELRYEDLVEDPDGEIKTVCEFLSLDFDPRMLDYGERARNSILPRAARYNPHLTEKPISKVRSWEELMSERQIEVFEAIAGPVLSELGYDRRYLHPGLVARLEATAGRLGLPVGRIRSTRADPRS